MPGLPLDPLAPITLPGGNGDLPPTQFPTLTRITVIDLVGPNAANRQLKSLEKRSVSLGQLVNQLIGNNNVIDDNYLRRDGSTQKSNGAGILQNMPMNNKRLVNMAVAVATGHAVEYDQFLAGLAPLAPVGSPAFTGTPTAPTPPAPSDNTRIATTEWVRDVVAGISFNLAPRLVEVQQTNFIRARAGDSQTENFSVQVEPSVGEKARYIDVTPAADDTSLLDFNYPGTSTRPFFGWNHASAFDRWSNTVGPSTVPSYGWPVLALAARHHNNNPRTEAYIVVTGVWYDALLDQIKIRGVVKHYLNAGTSTYISLPQGVTTFSVPVNGTESVLMTVSNQKGVANLFVTGSRSGPGQPAFLNIRALRQHSGHSNNWSGYGIWFPRRVITY